MASEGKFNNSIVDISVQYNFESPTTVSSYQIVSQHWKVEKKITQVMDY